MDEQQTATDHEISRNNAGQIVDEKLLNELQDKWISYCAIGGIVTETGFENVFNDRAGREVPEIITKISVTEFAQKLGVDRATLYKWKNNIPDFGMKVRQRREEIFPVARETALFNQAYLIAMTGRGQAAASMITMLLGHGAKLQLPKQRTELEAGQNLMELMNIARKKQIIEGETVERPNINP